MNVVIVSPTGGGKTYLACALGIAACQNEFTVRYWRMDILARRLVLARRDGVAHQKLLNEISDVEVLIIDDFLTVGIDSDAASGAVGGSALQARLLGLTSGGDGFGESERGSLSPVKR